MRRVSGLAEDVGDASPAEARNRDLRRVGLRNVAHATDEKFDVGHLRLNAHSPCFQRSKPIDKSA